jgi:hypothetical protein
VLVLGLTQANVASAQMFQGEIWTGIQDSIGLGSLTATKAHIAANPPDATFQIVTLDSFSGNDVAAFLGPVAAATLSGSGSAPMEYVAIRFSGYLDLLPGEQTFSINADDGHQLTVGGIVLSECETYFASGCAFAAQVTVADPGTGKTPVELIYFESYGGQGLIVSVDGAPAHAVHPPPINVISIDIKPGSDPNSINLCSNGTVPVAIFGSATFDVTNVNTENLRFAETAVKVVGKKDPMQLCNYEDINGDFISDLVCHYVTTDIAGIDGESSIAKINGELFDGTKFEGSDSVNIVKDTCY